MALVAGKCRNVANKRLGETGIALAYLPLQAFDAAQNKTILKYLFINTPRHTIANKAHKQSHRRPSPHVTEWTHQCRLLSATAPQLPFGATISDGQTQKTRKPELQPHKNGDNQS